MTQAAMNEGRNYVGAALLLLLVTMSVYQSLGVRLFTVTGKKIVMLSSREGVGLKRFYS